MKNGTGGGTNTTDGSPVSILDTIREELAAWAIFFGGLFGND